MSNEHCLNIDQMQIIDILEILVLFTFATSVYGETPEEIPSNQSVIAKDDCTIQQQEYRATLVLRRRHTANAFIMQKYD